MRHTQKYLRACQILTFSHATYEEFYQELNKLGWYWCSKNKKWKKDNFPVQETSKLIKIRVLTSAHKVEQIAELFIQNAESIGLKLLNKSGAYPRHPPNQNNASMYLTFEELED